MRTRARCGRIPLARSLAVGLCALAASQAATATAQSALPPAAKALLERLAGTALDGQRLLFGDLRTPPAAVERNPQLAELMERARRQDVTVPMTHPLYSAEMITAGAWKSDFFVANYGTALLLVRPYDEGRIPVVLVHGINGSPHDFSDMVARFEGSPYQPVCFFYPTGLGLQQAAGQLGARLQEFLVRHPTSRLVIIGHSMGGLVVKGMLDELAHTGALPNETVFVSMASPWRGVEAARYSDRLPASHPTSWDDLAPTSTFLSQIQETAFADRVEFFLFFGARSSNRLLTPLGNNDGVLTLESVLGSPLTRQARDVFGFYEDHTSILSSPVVYQRLTQVLDAELDRERIAALPAR
jgi:pimeloyl-ACP methyl ester carboxylesterase